MRFFLILTITLVGSVLSIRSFTFASCFYVWVILFRPLNFVHDPTQFLFISNWAGILLVGALVFGRKDWKFRLNIGGIFQIIILIICFISSLFSLAEFESQAEFITICKIIIPIFIITSCVHKEKTLLLIGSIIALSVGIWAVQAGLHGLLTGKAETTMRLGGQMSDRNDFAVGILMTLPICYYLTSNISKMRLKLFSYLFTLLVAISVIVSNSRASILGLIILIIIQIFIEEKHKIKKLFLLFLLIIIGPQMLPSYTIERLNTINWGGEQSESSARSRIVLMKSGFMAAEDNPLLGLGPGAWKVFAPMYIPDNTGAAYEPHSIWSKIAAELGFIGLSAYTSMFIIILYSLRKIQRESYKLKSTMYNNLSKMFQLSILAYCIAGSFFNQIYFEYMFLIVGLSGSFMKIWAEKKLNIEASYGK